MFYESVNSKRISFVVIDGKNRIVAVYENTINHKRHYFKTFTFRPYRRVVLSRIK